MSGFGNFSKDDEIVNSSYVQGVVTVTTTQVEAKVGGSKLSKRQMLRIYNGSSNTIYVGPSGVTTTTGEPIEKKQWVNIPVGDQISVYLIAASGSNSVIVSEWS